MKTIWYPGIPDEPGVYWYDSGFGHSDQPMLLQVTESTKYIFGDFGEMPLSSVYTESMADRVSYSPVVEADDWTDLTCIKKDRSRAWILTPEGYLGFGLLRPGWHNDVGGTIVWVEHPNTASSSGMWIKSDANYKFSLVEIPKIKKVKR
jgi:hypothetical protein